MTNTTLNFTTANPALSKATVKESSRQYINIRLSVFTEEERQALVTVLKAVAPESIENLPENLEKAQCGSLMFKENGRFSKTIPMRLHSSEDGKGLALEFDRKVYNLTNLEGCLTSISNVKLESYPDPTFTITLPLNDDDTIELPLPLKLNDEAYKANRENNEKFVKMLNLSLMKKNYAKIASFLKVAGSKGSGVSIKKFSELTPMHDYPFTGTYLQKTKNGMSRVLELGLDAEGQPIKVWSNTQMKRIFDEGVTVGEGATLSFTEYSLPSGTVCADCTTTGLVLPEMEASLTDLFNFDED